jgi:hypothetical protein
MTPRTIRIGISRRGCYRARDAANGYNSADLALDCLRQGGLAGADRTAAGLALFLALFRALCKPDNRGRKAAIGY